MTRRNKLFTCFLLTLLLAGGTTSLRSEVSSGCADTIGFIVMGITEGPDPILASAWIAVRPATEGMLNADGAGRLDGSPDIQLDLQNNRPHVVWSYNVGQDYDIAFSSWDGEGWTVKEYLSVSTQDDLDPRLSIADDGSFHVVWWEQASTPRIYLTSRAQTETDWSPRELIADNGMRPSVLVTEELRFVAFERVNPGQGKQIVVQQGSPDGAKALEVAAQTERTGPLEVVLHRSHGRIWMEWKHSDTEIAYSEFVNGSWVAPETIPWNDWGWVEDESARRLVRSRVVNP